MYTSNDILDFGKNIGLRLSFVYEFQPGYIVWAIKNKDNFKIDVESFLKLPNPRLIKSISSEVFSELFGVEVGNITDAYGLRLNAIDIKNSINDNSMTFSDDFFEFPKSIIKLNNLKEVN
ncbi:hypothetical protein [Polaribacter vadi]|jgi:hypothetical protein|uniref:hypothetical protein n=1 Tax=Polaribacter vadi TaxID=1774273 RepID=UPI0030EF5C95|tara:strand:- start:587 stop:946 length:360 start_codon:yes stop_codon:yes gene_type:complete